MDLGKPLNDQFHSEAMEAVVAMMIGAVEKGQLCVLLCPGGGTLTTTMMTMMMTTMTASPPRPLRNESATVTSRTCSTTVPLAAMMTA